MNVLEQMLNKDAETTGAEPVVEAVKVEKTNTEPVKTEPVVTNTTETTKTEGKEEPDKNEPAPLWKEMEFENEDQLKEFVTSNKNKQPEALKYASSNVEAYNNWVANGGTDDYSVYQTVSKFQASDNPSPEEMIKAIILKESMEDPEYRGKEAIRERKLRKEFGLDISAEDKALLDEDERDDWELKGIELKKKFKESASYFQDMQKKTTPVVDENLETRLKEGPTRLKDHLDKELIDFKLDIKELKDGDKFGDNSIYSVIFDESMKKTYMETYESMAKGNKYPDLSDGSHQQMKAVSTAMALATRFPQLTNNIFAAGREFERNSAIEKEIKDTNPSSVGTHTKNSTVNTESDDKSGDIFGKR